MSGWSMLDAELADTLEAVRRKRGLPPLHAPVGELARDIVGEPKPPAAGVCRYCGAPAPADVVCSAHSDLPHFDVHCADVVTQQTTGHRTHPVGGRASGGPGGEQ